MEHNKGCELCINCTTFSVYSGWFTNDGLYQAQWTVPSKAKLASPSPFWGPE